ncbi:Phosphoesterase family protein [Staphylococcus aureus]|nr:Phosphoesterase family protein [Staphylococcus aureus]
MTQTNCARRSVVLPSLFNRVKGNCDFYPEFENEAVAKYNTLK